jgi:hypothetical protein
VSETDDKVTKALARFDRVMAVVDEREGPIATQARRERQRKLRRYGRATRNAGLAVLVVSLVAIVVGVLTPIGMFGFLAAVGLAIGLAALLFVWSSREESALPSVPKDVPNAEMVQRFDSFLYRTRRALPAPAQPIVDSISAQLGTLRQTLERTDPLDPDAQDARRLMSVHLPGLIDRYANVPAAYRGEADAEGKTIDQRLVEGLSATRTALSDVSERLAKRDVDAFSTQGRFIESRYGQTD